MKKALFILGLTSVALSLGANAFAASDKICFGSTKDDTTKGSVLKAQITQDQITLKSVKGDFQYDGAYPVLDGTVKARDGKSYLQYKGEDVDQQDIILVDTNLLESSTTGLIQFRSRGEGFFNSVFVCKDDK